MNENTQPTEPTRNDDLRSIHGESTGWRVALVGAGPGDPGLLTLRGAELLRQCDVVLFDGLSNQNLLRHAPQAEHISVGKHGQTRIWKQAEIITEILRHARAGRRVVRLKGGDPAVFARTSEEVDAIRDAGFDFEIVPGITAALAAGSFAGIPITHRGLASAVALVTGHEEPGKAESDLDWEALARFPGTLVIYMGVTTAGHWTDELIRHGKSAGTPVAIVRRCSLPDQQIIHCTLGDVADQLTPATKLRPPVITIVGEVTQLSAAMSWFDRRPLFGKTVMNTRSSDHDDVLTSELEQLGASVINAPAIQIAELTDTNPIELAANQLADSNFDVVVFCSVHGVRYFFSRVFALGYDVRILARTKLAAVGAKTAAALETYHLKVDLTPDDFSGDAVAELLIGKGLRQCLIVRANRGSDDWVEKIRAAGMKATQVAAYINEDMPNWDDSILAAISDNRVDWVTATSSATASNVVRLAGDGIKQMKVASLSPVTTRALAAMGVQVDAEAKHATMKSLADAIVEWETGAALKQELNR